MFRPFYLILLVLLITSLGQASDDLLDATPASTAENIAFAGDVASGDSLKLLFARQRRTCPASYPVACDASSSRCCPSNSYCQPGGCCPRDSVTCNPGDCYAAGSVCCGTRACQRGSRCISSSSGRPTCCPEGYGACEGGYCCPLDTHCGLTIGSCQRFRVSYSTAIRRTTTTISVASTRRSTVETITSGESSPRSTSEPTASPSACPNDEKVFECEDEPIENKVKRFSEFKADGPLGKRQDTDDEVGGYVQYCKVCGVPIPIMFFPWVDGETEELVSSTCNGMRSMGAQDQVLLHWNGIGSVSTGKRQAARCRGYCASINENYNARYDSRNECDEFPPASSREGGAGAHRQCILREQNQLGGHMYNSYAALFKLGPDSPYIIRVLPGCGGISKREETRVQGLQERNEAGVEARDFNLVKRQQEGETQTIQGSSNKYIKDPRPGFPNGSGFIIVPLSEAVPGRYNLQFSLSSPVQNVSLVDGNGIEIVSTSPGDVTDDNMSWDLPDDTDLSIGAYVNEDNGVNISYTGSVIPASANQSASATGDRLSNAERMFLSVSNWGTFGVRICVWMCAWMLMMAM